MATAMLLAATATGAALGLFANVAELSLVPTGLRLVALSVIAAVWIPHELGLIRLPMLQRERQVPIDWRTRRGPIVGSAMYGAVLGVGFLTFVGHTGLYVVLAAAVLLASPELGALLFFTYATGRMTAVTLETIAQTRSPDWYFGLLNSRTMTARAQAAALALIAVLAAGTALHS